LAQAGEVNSQVMFETFNMGIGFVVIVPPHQAEATLSWFQSKDIAAYKIGEVVEGTGEVLGLSF
jgi:phosphoribosylformylglycinamidine cyclo-ligase